MKYAILAASISAAMLIAVFATPAMAAMAPAYTQVLSYMTKSLTKSEMYSVKANATIPTSADTYINGQLVYGYAWLDTTTTPIKAVVATIHPSFTDSAFSAGTSWHAHTAMIMPVNTQGTTILCLASLSSPSFRLNIVGKNLVEQLSNYDVPLTNANAATSFTLVQNSACPYVEVPLNGAPTALSLQVLAPAS